MEVGLVGKLFTEFGLGEKFGLKDAIVFDNFVGMLVDVVPFDWRAFFEGEKATTED